MFNFPRRSATSSTLIALTLAVVVSTTILPRAIRADAGLDAYQFARGLYTAERWELAEDAFQKFLKNFPKHERISLGLLYLGLSQIQQEKHEPARRTLETFVSNNPDNSDVPHARYRIAECSYYIGDLDRAVTEFDKCLKEYPKDPFEEFAWACLGDAQRRLGKLNDAAASLQTSIERFPRGRMAADARFGLAQTMEGLKKPDKAIVLYREVAKGSTEDRADAAQLALANLFFGMQKFQEAVGEYDVIEKKFPNSRLVPVARLNSGFALYQNGDYSQALSRFDAAEADPQKAVTAGYWKGLTLKALGDYSGAADVLSEVADKAGENPLVESVTYQMADCLFRAGQLDNAESAFLKVTKNWPEGQYADHSLYFATECIIQNAKSLTGDDRTARLKDAEVLLARFSKEYASSGIRLSHQLQRGQFLALRGTPEDLVQAEKIYQAVLDTTRREQTQAEARYQLARTRQSRGDNAGALEAIAPLANAVIKNPSEGLPESLVLYAYLSLEANQLEETLRSTESYLQNNPGGQLRDQAWAHRATAAAHSGNWSEADRAVSRLLEEHPTSPIVSRSIQHVAEIAFEKRSYQAAAKLFELLLVPGPDSPFHAAALSGLAWSQFKASDFAASEKRFRQFVEEHAKHELAAESAFMIGDSLQKAKKLAEAATAFESALSKYAPARQAFLAGLQAARILARTGHVEDADRVYGVVDSKFRDISEHDQLLNEWALVLYEAQRFDDADRVFLRLTQEHPDSSAADNARFTLAESDLVNGKIDQAKAAFSALSTDEKADAKVREDSAYRLVGIASELDLWQELISAVTAFEKQYPQSGYLNEMQFQRGNAQLQMGDFAAAEETLGKLAFLSNDATATEKSWFAHLWPLLAEAQIRQKKYESVIETAKQARAWNAAAPTLYLVDEVVGRAWKNQARFDEARTAFQRTIESEAGSRTETAAKAQLMIGETWFLQKDYQTALGEYLKVYLLYEFPEWKAPALFQAALCDELIGSGENLVKARKSYETVVKEFPDTEFATKAAAKLKQLNAGS